MRKSPGGADHIAQYTKFVFIAAVVFQLYHDLLVIADGVTCNRYFMVHVLSQQRELIIAARRDKNEVFSCFHYLSCEFRCKLLGLVVRLKSD